MISYLSSMARKRKAGSTQDLLGVTPKEGSGDTLATAQEQPFAPDKMNPMRQGGPQFGGSLQSLMDEQDALAGGSTKRRKARSAFMAGL